MGSGCFQADCLPEVRLVSVLAVVFQFVLPLVGRDDRVDIHSTERPGARTSRLNDILSNACRNLPLPKPAVMMN